MGGGGGNTSGEEDTPLEEYSGMSRFVSISSKDMKKLIDSKIDRVDMEQLMDQKANK
jgi:formylmethanofuran dehydrogenase subunit D